MGFALHPGKNQDYYGAADFFMPSQLGCYYHSIKISLGHTYNVSRHPHRGGFLPSSYLTAQHMSRLPLYYDVTTFWLGILHPKPHGFWIILSAYASARISEGKDFNLLVVCAAKRFKFEYKIRERIQRRIADRRLLAIPTS